VEDPCPQINHRERTWSHMLGLGEVMSIFIRRVAVLAAYLPFFMFSNSRRFSSIGLYAHIKISEANMHSVVQFSQRKPPRRQASFNQVSTRNKDAPAITTLWKTQANIVPISVGTARIAWSIGIRDLCARNLSASLNTHSSMSCFPQHGKRKHGCDYLDLVFGLVADVSLASADEFHRELVQLWEVVRRKRHRVRLPCHPCHILTCKQE
jgi:hypothetical protein